MNIVADLHLHTLYSDGVYNPEDIVQMAIDNGLKTISITDHDTFKAIDIAKEFAAGRLEIIPGVELSTEVGDKELHILGYFIDQKNGPLVKATDDFCHARENRGRLIVEKLNRLGINISFDDVLKEAKSAAIGRPHIARAIVVAGLAENTWDVFDRYLGDSSPAFVPKYKISPEEAIALIRDAGGIPVWAHPRTSAVEDYIGPLVEAGLIGLEVIHPSNAEEHILYLNSMAIKYDLVVTGGSDFHDKDSGKRVGDFGIDQEALNILKSRL